MTERRRCATPGCITLLARDNKDELCSKCQAARPLPTSGRGRPPGAKNKPKVDATSAVEIPQRMSHCETAQASVQADTADFSPSDEGQKQAVPPGRLTNEAQTDAIVDPDDDLEKLAEATWMEATGDGERVRLDLRMGTNVILARCYIANAKAKQLATLIDRVSGARAPSQGRPSDPSLRTTIDVAKMLDVEPRRLHYWIKQRYIDFERKGSGVALVWTEDQINRAIEVRDAFDEVGRVLRKAGLPYPWDASNRRHESGWTKRSTAS